jgi:hypothetical protein
MRRASQSHLADDSIGKPIVTRATFYVKDKSKNPNDFFSAGFDWLSFPTCGNLTRTILDF